MGSTEAANRTIAQCWNMNVGDVININQHRFEALFPDGTGDLMTRLHAEEGSNRTYSIKSAYGGQSISVTRVS